MSTRFAADRPLRLARSVAFGAIAMACTAPVLAHALDGGPAPESPWSTWSFEPWVVLCLFASAIPYALGVRRLWQRAGRGHGIGVGQASAFVGGWSTLGIALVSPIDPLGSVLFSAHMVQHELLMIVAAPLLVLGRPLAAWAWALPPAWRRATGRFFRHRAWRLPWRVATAPAVAWLVHALALWLWHLPALFEAALDDPLVHAGQHLSFLLTALLFWWSVLGPVTRREQGAALVSIFTTMVHTGALGALLTLARTAWYPHYLAVAPGFGITALEDQQLGGLIMWVPAGAVYLACGLFLAARWIEPRATPLLPTTLSVADAKE